MQNKRKISIAILFLLVLSMVIPLVKAGDFYCNQWTVLAGYDTKPWQATVYTEASGYGTVYLFDGTTIIGVYWAYDGHQDICYYWEFVDVDPTPHQTPNREENQKGSFLQEYGLYVAVALIVVTSAIGAIFFVRKSR